MTETFEDRSARWQVEADRRDKLLTRIERLCLVGGGVLLLVLLVQILALLDLLVAS